MEDSEAIVYLEDQSDVSGSIHDLANFEYPTPCAELQSNGQNKSIEKTDILVFLDIVGKLADYIRGLQLKTAALGSKNERLLEENSDLILENARSQLML